MAELLTAAQMRAIEAAAIASGQETGLQLMERAGAGVVAAVLEEWPEMALAPQRAVVLCGPGNNGGDGFVVARLLHARGWAVEVFLYGDPGRMPPDARVNHDRWAAIGPVAALEQLPHVPQRPDLWVDALFGTGLRRPVALPLGSLVPQVTGGRVVAVDVPSGLCADSGRVIGGACVTADLTVTFHAAKCGHMLAEGPAACGRLVVAGIGLPDGENRAAGQPVTQQAAPHVTALRKAHSGHKFSHGHALILSGPATRTGAARLAARGALRVGAGLVTVGAPAEALAECAAQLTAIMLRRVEDGAALATVLEDRRITALCLGPGLGVDARGAGLVAAALQVRDAAAQDPVPGLTRDLRPGGAAGDTGGPGSSPGRGLGRRPLVLDADALTLLSRDETLFAALHDTCILTPHAGEFARLFPDIAAKLDTPATAGPAYSKADATREAAVRAGCVVLFKGADTVIADPSGHCAINAAAYDRAAPWLATAGSGDVLAGFIAGLLARGFAPMQAAETAAWLHTECARAFGPGLIAEDLPEVLPEVLRGLLG